CSSLVPFVRPHPADRRTIVDIQNVPFVRTRTSPLFAQAVGGRLFVRPSSPLCVPTPLIVGQLSIFRTSPFFARLPFVGTSPLFAGRPLCSQARQQGQAL